MERSKARESIITTAAKLLYKQGYSNTGINQIIGEANIAKSTLYQHFRSKEDLLIVYLNETGETTINALKQASKNGLTAIEKILSIFNYLEELVASPDFYGCHFLNIVYEMPNGDERVRVQVKKQKDAVRALFCSILASPDKLDLADEIYTLFEGALIAHKIHNSTWPIVSAKNMIRRII